MRNFNWRSETDLDPIWEQRTYYLSRVTDVDLIMSYWMGETIAHTIVSFGFEKSGAAPRTTAAITVAGMAVTTAPIMVGRLSSPPAIRAPGLQPVQQTVPRLLPQLMPQPAPTITRRPTAC